MYHIDLKNSPHRAVVDDADADLAGVAWRLGEQGYVQRTVGKAPDRTTERLHVVVARRMFGAIPPGLTVDHVHGNRLDCRRSVLRLATRSQQMINRRRRSLGGVETPYKGVSFHKRTGTWRAEMRHKGRYLHLGHFQSDVEAARAYDAKAAELYGAFARLNFPSEGAEA